MLYSNFDLRLLVGVPIVTFTVDFIVLKQAKSSLSWNAVVGSVGVHFFQDNNWRENIIVEEQEA